MHAYIHTCIQATRQTGREARIQTPTDILPYIHTYIIQTYIHEYNQKTQIHTYIHTDKDLYIHTNMKTYIHTHIQPYVKLHTEATRQRHIKQQDSPTCKHTDTYLGAYIHIDK